MSESHLSFPESEYRAEIQKVYAAIDRALLLQPRNDVALSIKGSFYRALGNVGWIQRQLGELLFGDIPDGGFKEAEDALARLIAGREAEAVSADEADEEGDSEGDELLHFLDLILKYIIMY